MNDIESEWKEARSRLEIYLRALQLTDQKQQERIIQVVLQRAAGKYVETPDQSPTDSATMNEMRELSEQWLEKVSQPPEQSRQTMSSGFTVCN